MIGLTEDDPEDDGVAEDGDDDNEAEQRRPHNLTAAPVIAVC